MGGRWCSAARRLGCAYILGMEASAGSLTRRVEEHEDREIYPALMGTSSAIHSMLPTMPRNLQTLLLSVDGKRMQCWVLPPAQHLSVPAGCR